MIRWIYNTALADWYWTADGVDWYCASHRAAPGNEQPPR